MSMSVSRRFAMRGLIVSCVMLIAMAAAYAADPQLAPAASKKNTHAQQVRRGRYLARAGDCVACHTTRGGKAFAGNRALPTPFGTIYSPNITPDPETGIGKWSAQDFWNALHDGKGRDGRLLYPAFPYPSYTHVTRDDADAIFAYLQTLEPVHSQSPEPDFSFPYSWRKLLLGWRALYFDKGVYQPDLDKSRQWNRGAYLVQGLGHCNACHSPRNALGAVRSGQHLRGSMVPAQGWFAPDLGPGHNAGLAGWSRQDIVDLLATGRSSKGSVYGPMAEVVQESLQYLRKDDLQAIAAYLHDLPGRKHADQRSGFRMSQVQGKAWLASGRKLYAKHCTACHQDDGRGVPQVYPALDGNSLVTVSNPVNPVRVVLLGGFEPTTKRYPRPYSMPPFMQRLSDRQVAAVVSYIRMSWGNKAGAVSPKTVAEYRSIPMR